MLSLSAYSWWKFLHVAGVIVFVAFHGVSMTAALRVRKERDRVRIATMLQLSGSSVTGMYVSLLWLVVFGVVAGIQGGFWNDGWFWIAIGRATSRRCRRNAPTPAARSSGTPASMAGCARATAPGTRRPARWSPVRPNVP